jgi:hypothetical protein
MDGTVFLTKNGALKNNTTEVLWERYTLGFYNLSVCQILDTPTVVKKWYGKLTA